MILQRCKDQPSLTLEQFYGALGEKTNSLPDQGSAMLALIERLRAHPSPCRIYGLTSHHRLCLLAFDTSDSPWFVILYALDHRNYAVEYLVPEHIAPWPNAIVRGEARSLDDAFMMVLTAMVLSGGWPSLCN